MSSALFPTIGDREWKAALAAARARRRPSAVRARIFRGMSCPVCGLPALNKSMLGGTRFIHSPRESCWMPSTECVLAAGLAGSGTRFGAESQLLLLPGGGQ